MKHGSIALLVVVGCFIGSFVGCLYGDPDYGQTHFSCDDDHPCPEGQTCNTVAGTCSGGGSGPGVACGTAGTCTSGQECCVEQLSGACVPAGTPCRAAAACDQSTDCGADHCCNTDDNGPECVPAVCDPTGTNAACVTVDDCPANAHFCCRVDPTLPWGYCYVNECFI